MAPEPGPPLRLSPPLLRSCPVQPSRFTIKGHHQTNPWRPPVCSTQVGRWPGAHQGADGGSSTGPVALLTGQGGNYVTGESFRLRSGALAQPLSRYDSAVEHAHQAVRAPEAALGWCGGGAGLQSQADRWPRERAPGDRVTGFLLLLRQNLSGWRREEGLPLERLGGRAWEGLRDPIQSAPLPSPQA